MKRPATLEEAIVAFCEKWSRSNPRPDLSDKTIRKLFAGECAGEIRKYAKVTRK